jgi:predicted transcriptional regulator
MKRKLTISLSPNWKAGLREAARKAAKGMESGRYQGEVLNFESPAVLFGHLTEKRWDLIRLLQAKEPMGVRELARQAGRGVRRVHDDVAVLLELGIFEKNEKGQLLCPYVDMHVMAA